MWYSPPVTEPRRRGRPPTTGITPKRNIRVGAIWDEAAAIAASRGEGMREVIERALRSYVRRHRPRGVDG